MGALDRPPASLTSGRLGSRSSGGSLTGLTGHGRWSVEHLDLAVINDHLDRLLRHGLKSTEPVLMGVAVLAALYPTGLLESDLSDRRSSFCLYDRLLGGSCRGLGGDECGTRRQTQLSIRGVLCRLDRRWLTTVTAWYHDDLGAHDIAFR